ncbi:Transcription factor vrtR1 like protein [Verticillium longisporum]|uniref:Transcription factor vrtR1 like protein n=1 Tax=Verticillium longisporum TaxID=100787 RepID=A0A8I2ZAK6_VERLO|nr:Transcription factor vrtR1 like protein [Verticillium longisporum]RBQ93332.1 hypothetical protein VDGD_08945 [Verticillium dahliae]
MSAPIAPTPKNRPGTAGAAGYASHPSMAFSCQPCARRKVKCDRSTPLCSSCRKGRLDCIYEAPAPRARKRKPGEAGADDVYERLARYERVLRRHGLLEAAGASPAVEKDEEALEDPIFPLWNLPSGKLVVGQGKSRYVNSHLWRNLGDDEMERMGDEHAAHHDDDDDAADEEDGTVGIVEGPASDPLTGAFLGGQHHNLLMHHPTHAEAMILWAAYVDNVEPLLKVLHIPSMAKTIDTLSKQPGQANKADECLAFAVYHFAIVSMSDEECLQKLGSTSREVLLQRYNQATRQALVNASFLSTTAMTVLQALVLHLVCCRNEYDPHTFWILTGVATRIAQRMGLHRDGEVQGLSPFDVQMRRRLFFQILPLDGASSRMAGVGVSIPNDWDTRQPLNIDDEQIWPTMTEAPVAREGATEMMFCLARSSLGIFIAKPGKSVDASKHLDDRAREWAIKEAEKEVEERYIRYCDFVNPLHMLTISSARAGITAMRLRIRLQKVKNQNATPLERMDLFRLAQRILDTDAAVLAHAGLGRFRWHTRWFFLWGTWDSLVYILMTLWQRCELLSDQEKDDAWGKLEELCRNHIELAQPERALYLSFGRLFVRAWDACHDPLINYKSEPVFISTLRYYCEAGSSHASKKQKQKIENPTSAGSRNSSESVDWFKTTHEDDPSQLCMIHPMADADADKGFDEADWMLWDQLIRDYQIQSPTGPDEKEGNSLEKGL